MEIQNLKPTFRDKLLFISNLFKKITTIKRGYLLVNIQPKAYNQKYAQYKKIVE